MATAAEIDEPDTLAEDVIGFIEAFCRVPSGSHVGDRIKLLPFQKRFIKDVYTPGVRRAYLSMGRKNGKTALVACLVLAHLVGPAKTPNASVISGAHSEKQAAFIFSYAVKMIQLEPALADRLTVRLSPKRIDGPLGTSYLPVSSRVSSAFGDAPKVAIVDELGQTQGETNRFFDAIATSTGAYEDGLVIVISTQAESDSDLFSILLDDAAKRADPSVVSHVYAADDDCELSDKAQWEKANPGLGVFRSLADLKALAEQAERMPSQESSFRNLYLNQRIEREDPYIARTIWRGCGGKLPERDIDSELTWYGGLDLSSSRDLTAYVRVAWWQSSPRAKPLMIVRSRFWYPSGAVREGSQRDRQPYERWSREGWIELTPGNAVDYRYVARQIIPDVASGLVVSIGFDDWNMRLLWKAWKDENGDDAAFDRVFKDFRQGFKSMSPALRLLDRLLYDKELRHGDNPVLTMCAQNSVVQSDAAGNRKLTKAVETRRIDGMIALLMAATMSTNQPVRRVSMYDDPDILDAYRRRA